MIAGFRAYQQFHYSPALTDSSNAEQRGSPMPAALVTYFGDSYGRLLR
jgi:hypothetical protein